MIQQKQQKLYHRSTSLFAYNMNYFSQDGYCSPYPIERPKAPGYVSAFRNITDEQHSNHLLLLYCVKEYCQPKRGSYR